MVSHCASLVYDALGSRSMVLRASRASGSCENLAFGRTGIHCTVVDGKSKSWKEDWKFGNSEMSRKEGPKFGSCGISGEGDRRFGGTCGSGTESPYACPSYRHPYPALL